MGFREYDIPETAKDRFIQCYPVLYHCATTFLCVLFNQTCAISRNFHNKDRLVLRNHCYVLMGAIGDDPIMVT
eukprot:323843-Amorphochlora_amoeboformis.AAC.1